MNEVNFKMTTTEYVSIDDEVEVHQDLTIPEIINIVKENNGKQNVKHII